MPTNTFIAPRTLILLRELTDHADVYAGLTPAAIAAALNAPVTVPNPLPQPTVPVTFDIVDMLKLIKPAEALAILDTGGGELARMIDRAIASGNRKAILALGELLAATVLSPDSAGKVAALLGATELDPKWTATLPKKSRAREIGLMRVTALDVATAQSELARQS